MSSQHMLDIFDAGCTKCKLHRGVDDVCEPGFGFHVPAEVMIVGKMPNSHRYQEALETDLRAAGFDFSKHSVYWASALKCRNFEANASNSDVKACREYLDAEIAAIKPKFILTLGNEALLSVTGHSGITKYRGRPIEKHGATVMPSISPAAVLARPQNRPGYQADLKLFAALVEGRVAANIPMIDYVVVDTIDKLRVLRDDLFSAHTLSFDIETNIVPLHEHDPRARIISLAGTYVMRDTDEIRGFAIPLYHPESAFKKSWRSVLRFLAEAISSVAKRIAHNGKFDCRWLRKFGITGLWNTFDTMLAVHLLDENAQKGLKPQAQMRLGVSPWGIDTSNLLLESILKVLEYNFLDTYYTYLIYLQLREELKDQRRLLRLDRLLMIPASKNLIPCEGRGMWLDVPRLRERHPIAQQKLNDIEAQILSWLPDPESGNWPTDSKGRPLTPNFNRSNFALWMLFDLLELPVLARGKEKQDGSLGDPSMAEGMLLELREAPDHHPVVDLMLARVEHQKALSSFFAPYEKLHDENDRVHSSFKLYGTVTGRLSSGKEDLSKLTGRVSAVRGINLQQVPRDPFIRGLFGATPGFTWIEADFSQIELRIAAFLAKERHMIQLYQQGEDIHMITTMGVTGLPKSKVTKEIRKKIGKPVNFGFLYGMGWTKFILTAFNNYGVRFSEKEAKAYRRGYFELYPDLQRWHDRQRKLVEVNGRVQSPIGRVRHLPDIYSPEGGVRSEAERQAINSPVQGLASDMALAGMNLFIERLEERGLQDKVFLLGLVHDAINIEARDDVAAEAMVLLKESMEDMQNMRKKFGLIMTVPVIADVKVGRHWGDSVELTPEQVYDYPGTDRILEMNIPY